jgi:hypothetical protein
MLHVLTKFTLNKSWQKAVARAIFGAALLRHRGVLNIKVCKCYALI